SRFQTADGPWRLTNFMFDNKLTHCKTFEDRMPAFAWQITISPRFELFLALWSALSARARRHSQWRQRVRERLPPAFHRAQGALGACPELWILFFDAPGP